MPLYLWLRVWADTAAKTLQRELCQILLPRMKQLFQTPGAITPFFGSSTWEGSEGFTRLDKLWSSATLSVTQLLWFCRESLPAPLTPTAVMAMVKSLCDTTAGVTKDNRNKWDWRGCTDVQKSPCTPSGVSTKLFCIWCYLIQRNSRALDPNTGKLEKY